MDSSSGVILNLKYFDKIIDFITNNQDVGKIIIDYMTIEYKAEDPYNIYSSGLFQKKELKNKILSEYHTCEVILILKKILQKTILDIKNDGRWARKIIRIFKRTKYKNRKQNFYEIAKTKIESKLLVANNQKVSDYILINDLRFCFLLLDKIIEIYEKKDSQLRTLQIDIDDLIWVLSDDW